MEGKSVMPEYEPPVDRLLSYPAPEFAREDKWPDYPKELGLGPEHVGALIRMATDPELYEGTVEEGGQDFYGATIHARRALGQLGAAAVEAAGPLLRSMEEYGELDDFWTEELPTILGKIGPGAIPEVVAVLNDPDRELWTRVACATTLGKIAEAHPEERERCVSALADFLERRLGGEDHEIINGTVVGALLDLKAVEAAEAIERAFAADVVDPTVAGDWPVVRFELGLGPKPPGHRTREELQQLMRREYLGDLPRRPDLAKLKKKRKAQKKARKRSRKRR